MVFHTTFDSTNKIWSGRTKAPSLNPNVSVGQAILWMLGRNPNKCSQVGVIGDAFLLIDKQTMFFQISANNGIRLTNSQIRTKTIRAAQNLRKLGYENGEIIGIIAKNSHHLAPIVFAAMAIGCPINTLDPTFNEAEISHMFNKTKPKLIFCDTDILAAVRNSLKIINLTPKIFTFGESTSYSDCVEDLFADSNIDEAEYDFVYEMNTIVKNDNSNSLKLFICQAYSIQRWCKSISCHHMLIGNYRISKRQGLHFLFLKLMHVLFGICRCLLIPCVLNRTGFYYFADCGRYISFFELNLLDIRSLFIHHQRFRWLHSNYYNGTLHTPAFF